MPSQRDWLACARPWHRQPDVPYVAQARRELCHRQCCFSARRAFRPSYAVQVQIRILLFRQYQPTSRFPSFRVFYALDAGKLSHRRWAQYDLCLA